MYVPNHQRFDKLWQQLAPSVPDAQAEMAGRKIRDHFADNNKHPQDYEVVELGSASQSGQFYKIANLQAQNANLKKMLIQEQNASKAHAATIATLQSDKSNLTTKIHELQAQLQVANDAVSQMKAAQPKPKLTIDEQADMFRDLLTRRESAEKDRIQLEGQVTTLQDAVIRLKQQLALAQAAPKPQPANPKIQRERLEYLRIAQYLGGFVSEDVWNRCVGQGISHANLVDQATRKIKWPTDEKLILGEVGLATRGSPTAARKF